MTDSNKKYETLKQQIAAKSIQISATWTLDTVEEKIMTVMGREIQDEVDWGVLCSIDPDKKHWIELDFSDTAKEAGRDVIEAWCKETFNHGYFVFSNRIMFHREADAEFFLLRWS